MDDINLVGAAIGNGVLDFLFQEPSYAEYAYYHGLIPLAAKERFDLEWTQCLQEVSRLQPHAVPAPSVANNVASSKRRTNH